MLLKVEKGIRDVICQAIHWFAKANNYYIRDYDYDKESTYLVYCNVSNLYRWTLLRVWKILDGGKTCLLLMKVLSKIMMKILTNYISLKSNVKYHNLVHNF